MTPVHDDVSPLAPRPVADLTPLPEAVCAPFSHVGVSVPDITAAITWYREVLGFQLLDGPHTVSDDSPTAAMLHDIYGPVWHQMHQAHLSAGNGIGIELFQFVVPVESQPDHEFAYWRPGVFHLCVICSDVSGLAARIGRNGGRQRTGVYTPQPGFTMCYCEDPWGNALEVNNRSYESAHASQRAQ